MAELHVFDPEGDVLLILKRHQEDDSEDLAPSEAAPSLSADAPDSAEEAAGAELGVRTKSTGIESKPADSLTPEQIADLLTAEFPRLTDVPNSTTSQALVHINFQHFGKGGSKQHHFLDLVAYQKAIQTKWALS
ncbi:hypothetical protein DL98DRAFT_596822 [Cadophora sp. DSE1049]|nr:hypothetical protein DL98DRAFT_596822 [Cadophora sp. DSE1049]